MDKKEEASVFIKYEESTDLPVVEKKEISRTDYYTVHRVEKGLHEVDSDGKITKLFGKPCELITNKKKSVFIPDKLIKQGVAIYSTHMLYSDNISQLITEPTEMKFVIVTFDHADWDYISFL